MAALSPAIDENALRLAAVSLQLKRANDPWDGPHGSARPNQLPPPGEWKTWMIMAGRGFGKTRSGAEFIRKRVQSGQARRIVIAGPTAADIRDIMVEGESGLLAVCERAGVGVTYIPSKRRVQFANGAYAICVSADEPKRFRGLQCDTFWCDELASWRYADAWDQLQLGHRLKVERQGVTIDPRGVVTTTPRPIPIIKKLIAKANVAVTRGSTFENAANLADEFIADIRAQYDGTTLGRQELYAEILEDVEGALWQRAMIDRHRVRDEDVPALKTIAVAVDPATTFGEDSDETGVAVAGVAHDGHVYVLHGSGHRESPQAWAERAIRLYETHDANQIVAESNQGGEMVRQTIIHASRDLPMKPRIQLIHASRGKTVRAEPVVALYEQGKVHHVGMFGSLEDQMCFPAETPVIAADITASSVRKYTGEMITIRTARGELTGTAGHPILTSCGFVSLGNLHDGLPVMYNTEYERDLQNLDSGRIGSLHQALHRRWNEPAGQRIGDWEIRRLGTVVRETHRNIPDVCQPRDVEESQAIAGRTGVSGGDHRRRGLGQVLAQPQGGQDQARGDSRHDVAATDGLAGIEAEYARCLPPSVSQAQPAAGVVIHVSGDRVSAAVRGTLAVHGHQATGDGPADPVQSLTTLEADTLADLTRGMGVGGAVQGIEAEPILEVRRTNVIDLPVYNVETRMHHYSASGIVVHNCVFPLSEHDDQVDALVHAITAVAPAQRRGMWST